MRRSLWILALGLVTAACSSSGPEPADGPSPQSAGPHTDLFATDPFPSTYERMPGQQTLIRHATVLTGTGAVIEDGAVLFRDGQIVGVA